MTPEIEKLKAKIALRIVSLTEEIQLKTGDKAILERELRGLSTGKPAAAVVLALESREISLC